MKLHEKIPGLLLGLILAATKVWAVDGTFTVTESWMVTLDYSDFADPPYTGTKHFSGTQSGTIVVNNGHYALIDKIGIPWTAPGSPFTNRTIYLSGGPYYYISSDDYCFAPAYGAQAYGLVFLGCFAVKVPLIDGEVPAFYSYEYYSADGDSLTDISGGGNMVGSSLRATVTSSSKWVRVVGKPTISQQPQSQTLTAGQDVTLQVIAAGDPPLYYFWRKGTTVLTGKTNSTLVLTNLQPSDAGGYSVIVSNAGGTVTSQTAQLTVNPLPPPWFEGWEKPPVGIRFPSTNLNTVIPGDKGTWMVGDTVATTYPDCGLPVSHVDILIQDGRKLLKLTSVNSGTDCADNISVAITDPITTSLPYPLLPTTQISFFEQGSMTSPEWNGYFNCILPPCGDTVNLRVIDDFNNQVVYIFQRASNYVQHTNTGYVEIFLDPAGGEFSRNLRDDFARIAGAANVGNNIRAVEFAISDEGWAVLDDLRIGSPYLTSSDTTKPTVAITSPANLAQLTDSAVTILGTAGDNVGIAFVEYRLENTNGISPYQHVNGTTAWSANVPALLPGMNTIRVRALDVSGNYSTEVTRSFSYVLSAPIIVQTNGNGTVTPNYNGQLLAIGKSYTMTAKAGAGSVFSNWTGNGSVLTNGATLKFIMQSNLVLQANFIPNPFIAVAGAYNGLFFDTNGVTHPSSGYFSATTTKSGGYTAKMQLAGKSYSLAGQFSVDGRAMKSVDRTGLSAVLVELTWELDGGDRILGSVKNADWTAELLAYRSSFNAVTNKATQAGKYTMIIPGSDNSTTTPAGDGFGTVTVSTAGSIQFSGTLAEGTKLTQKTTLSSNGQWPFYVSLYSGQGSALSWLTFTNEDRSDFSGAFSWIKPAMPAAKYYPAGFSNEVTAAGSRYVSYGTTNRVLDFTSGLFAFSGGNLLQAFTNDVILNTNNKVTNLSSNKLTLTITASSGLLKGSVNDPITGKAIPFNGTILQKQNLGAGFFLGTNQSGRIFFGQP